MSETLVDILPTSMELLHRDAARAPSVLRRALAEPLVQRLARGIAAGSARDQLRFSVVDTARKWAQIRRLRLDTYRTALPYMCDVVNADGVDAYDARSVVFGAWMGEQAIATVRLTAWPFELGQLLEPPVFAAIVPEHRRLDTLEFSRLISVRQPAVSRVMPALLAYAGIHLTRNTGCRHYIGYTKSSIFKVFNGFLCASEQPPFVIPGRGSHDYRILQGEFRRDIDGVIERNLRPALLGRVVKRLL